MQITDTELIQKVLEGNIDAFGQLIARYQGRVYGLAFHFVGNFADAEDVAQEVFLEAFEHLSQLRNPSRFGSWLSGITRNVCMMWLRSQKEKVGIDELSDEELDRAGGISRTSPDAIMEKQELNHTVMQAISALPENYRLALTLYYLDEMSYQEISDFLGTPMNTVKSWLHRAKTRLRKEILEMAPEMFATQKIGNEFTEKVEKAICERYEEQIEPAFDVKETDVIVVCPELRKSRIHITFWDKQQIQISGRKVLLGATVKEASERQAQIQLDVEVTDDFM